MQPANRPVIANTGMAAGHRAMAFIGTELETYMNIKMQKLLPITATLLMPFECA